MRDNLYAEQVKPIFELARIDYGKIDFAFLGGRMQVWEINTNPGITTFSGDPDPDRQPAFDLIAQAFKAAVRALDAEASA